MKFMKNVQVALRKKSVVPSQSVRQPFIKNRNLAPVTEIQKQKHKKDRSTLHDQILVDQYTGHMFMKALGFDLMFPMLVVRHGETNGNVKRMFQGQIDNAESSLNDVGKKQVRRAAKHLYEQLEEFLGANLEEFAKSGKLIILKSPMSRAQDTANAFIEYFKHQTGIFLDSHVEEKLVEMGFGALEGFSIEEVEDEELKELALRYWALDATVDWKGTGESFLDVVTRANALLEDLNAQYRNQEVFVIAFAHGISINALRTVVGDKALIEDDGMIAFRKHVLSNAESHWLGRSQQLAERLFRSGAQNN
jgi:broad specificity phosphatase PhoE